MYYRSQGYRYGRDMRIPINYGGNAFTTEDTNRDEQIITINSNQEDDIESSNANPALNTEKEAEPKIVNESNSSEEQKTTPTSIFKSLGSTSLFGRIGSEELLIIALIFLLSDTDSENDIIWLLLLLLFIK